MQFASSLVTETFLISGQFQHTNDRNNGKPQTYFFHLVNAYYYYYVKARKERKQKIKVFIKDEWDKGTRSSPQKVSTLYPMQYARPFQT